MSCRSGPSGATSFAASLLFFSVAQAKAARIASKKCHVLSCLKAMNNLLDAYPRITGLMAGKPQLGPLLACLQPMASSPPANSGAGSPGSQQGQGEEGQPWEVAAAALALTVLVKLTQDGGCVEAMADEALVLPSLWLVNQGSSDAVSTLALRLLSTLASTATAAWAAACQGGAVYLLSAVLPAHQPGSDAFRDSYEVVRVAAASLLSRLSSHSLHGTRVVLLMGRLLPAGLVAALQDGPGESAVQALSYWSETPERVWNARMSRRTADELAALAATARSVQSTGEAEWAPPDGFSIQHDELQVEHQPPPPGIRLLCCAVFPLAWRLHPTYRCPAGLLGPSLCAGYSSTNGPLLLQDELYVGGVYVRLFLKDPRFPLRNPKRFVEGLLDTYVREVTANATDAAVLLSAAAVALLRVHALLADHAVQLGYLSKLLELLRGSTRPGEAASTRSTQFPKPSCCLPNTLNSTARVGRRGHRYRRRHAPSPPPARLKRSGQRGPRGGDTVPDSYAPGKNPPASTVS